jgi:two-component system cell cycle sensor histidine kinase/response regulator CckA
VSPGQALCPPPEWRVRIRERSAGLDLRERKKGRVGTCRPLILPPRPPVRLWPSASPPWSPPPRARRPCSSGRSTTPSSPPPSSRACSPSACPCCSSAGARPAAPQAVEAGTDLALVRAALEASPDAAAVTDAGGALLAANSRYERWFGIRPPLELPFGDELRPILAAATRDGQAEAAGLEAGELSLTAQIRAAGQSEGGLLWRFVRTNRDDAAAEAGALLRGEIGRRLASTGLMTVLTAADGRVLEANAAFHARAGGEAEVAPGTPLVDLLVMSEQHQFHFAREGKAGGGLRILQVPLAEEEGGPSLFLLLDELGGVGGDSAHNINALLEILPLGLAVTDRDGRFVYLNAAFRRAAGLSRTAMPTWPSDLVVDEDKAAVADSIRRFARGASLSGDVAVRLKANAEEPVALTVAGARGPWRGRRASLPEGQ